MKIRIDIANIFLVLGLGILLCSINIRDIITSELGVTPKLSAPVLPYESSGVLLNNNGVDPLQVANDRHSPIYNSIFFSQFSVSTSAHWQPPLATERLANTYWARRKKGDKLSKRSSAYTEFIGRKSSLPIVSIIADKLSFFHPDTGLYVQGDTWHEQMGNDLLESWFMKKGNYSLRGRSAETDGIIQFFDKSGRRYFSEEVALRINGNATRSYPQKSLRVLMKDEHILTPWGDKVHSLLLRNGGNTATSTIIGDLAAQKLFSESDLMFQRGQSVVVLINGDYWGIHNIRDRIKVENIAMWKMCEAHEVTIFEGDKHDKGNPKRSEKLLQILARLREGEAIEYKEFKKEIDLKEFSEYVLAQAFLANTDWPRNNFSMYKIRKGKWHPIVSDLDFCLGYNNLVSADKNMFSVAVNEGTVGLLMTGLLQYREFRELFMETYEKFKLGSVYDHQKFSEIVDSLASNIRMEIPHHIARWRTPESSDYWEQTIEELKNFHRERLKYFDQHVNEILTQ